MLTFRHSLAVCLTQTSAGHCNGAANSVTPSASSLTVENNNYFLRLGLPFSSEQLVVLIVKIMVTFHGEANNGTNSLRHH
jgi:hypothetical protein